MGDLGIHRWTHQDDVELHRPALDTRRVVVGYRGRPEGAGRCEDAALVIQLPNDSWLLAVADGMGGGARAADASAAIIDAIVARGEQLAQDTASRAQVLDAIEETDDLIRSWGVGAGSTVVVAQIEGNQYRTYHVGDSEAVVTGQRGLLKWQTISHSPVGYAQASGLMDESSALVHEERHLVDSMLGLEGMRVDVGERRSFDARDTLLLASDGLFDNLSMDEIVQLIRKGSLESVSSSLLELSRERMQSTGAEKPGKADDLAFILYRPPRTASSKDSS